MTQSFATRGKWREGPENRWSFRNVDKVIPCDVIPTDPAEAVPLATTRKRWRPGLLQRALLGFTSTDAMVVLIDGAVAYEYYANENGPQTRHILMSASKAVTGLLLGILANEGVVDYEVPVERYLPEMGGTRYEGATIRNLIDMRAGVVLDAKEEAAYAAATNWEPAASTPPSADLKSFLRGLSGPPGKHGGPFSYISANTDLLGWVIERATGRKIAELVSDKLWRPMGAESHAGVTLDQDGLARCAGGFCATARDLARLGQLFLTDGRQRNRQVVPGSVLADICKNADRSAWAYGQWGRLFRPISRNMGSRSGWYIVEDGPLRLFAMGIHGQNLFVDLERRMVVAKFSSWKAPNDPLPFLATHMGLARFRR